MEEGEVAHALERVGVAGAQFPLAQGQGTFQVFLRLGILTHRPVGPAEREPDRRLRPLLALEAPFEPLGGPVEQRAHRNVPVAGAAGLITDVGLAEQVLPQEVVDRPGDGRFLVGSLLLGGGSLALAVDRPEPGGQPDDRQPQQGGGARHPRLVPPAPAR